MIYSRFAILPEKTTKLQLSSNPFVSSVILTTLLFLFDIIGPISALNRLLDYC